MRSRPQPRFGDIDERLTDVAIFARFANREPGDSYALD